MMPKKNRSIGKVCISLVILAAAILMVFPGAGRSARAATGSINPGAGEVPGGDFSSSPVEVFLPLVVKANSYYVSPSGSDGNPGTQAKPWKTIQKAANTLAPGEGVTVLSGTYNERVQVSRSGSANAQIRFEALGTVVMRGFTIHANYIIISGFEITNTPNAAADGMGIFLEGSHCIIENNYVHYATRGGILVYTEPNENTTITDDLIRNNILYRNSQFGIEVHGRNHRVEGNEISHTIQYHPGWVNPPDYVDADGIRFFGSGHVLRGNYIHDITYDDPENVNPFIDCFVTYYVSPYYEAASNVLIEKNTCKEAEVLTTSWGGEALALSGANHLTIRNNLLLAFVHLGAINDSYLTIANNVMVSDLSLPEQYFPESFYLENCQYITIKNNIVFNQPGHTYWFVNSSTGLSVDYNISYRTDGEHAWDTPYPHDLWNVNPLFIAPASFDFHLQAGSPAINAGYNIGSTVPDDYDGTTRPIGPAYDIGAFEYIP